MASCSQCGMQGVPLKRCSMCKQVSYCGVECQRAAWRQHTKTCVPPPPSALWTAAAAGFSQEVSRLLSDGPDIEERGGREQTSPLHGAASGGHHEAVLVLLEHGADVDAAKNLHKRTALQAASGGGHEKVVVLLLQHGAVVSAQSSIGTTALHDAANSEKFSYDSEPSSFKASTSYLAVMRLLLQHGAEVSIKAKNGTTPLHYAVFDGAVEPARLLLQHGADISAVENECDQETLLHWATGHSLILKP